MPPTISIYTFVRNGLHLDYHVVPMLRHHLGLADEIIVNEGRSSDGTLEAISSIDPRIKIFQSDWGQPDDIRWFVQFKDAARRHCAGEWCILLDCDEFIPQWEFEAIKDRLQSTDAVVLTAGMLNFYGNYKVYHRKPKDVNWPWEKAIVHRNDLDIEVWGDGSNVRSRSGRFTVATEPYLFTIHHFGFVRHPARLREKWRNVQAKAHSGARWGFPSFVFDFRPHNWLDPAFLPGLAIYDGPFVDAVVKNPEEFVRDGFALYEYLRGHQSAPVSS